MTIEELLERQDYKMKRMEWLEQFVPEDVEFEYDPTELRARIANLHNPQEEL